jgi:hypothetical protein
MIFFSAYLHRLLRRRRASRGVPTMPPGEPGLARLVGEEIAVLVRALAGRAIRVVRRKRGPARAPGEQQRP